MNNNIYNNNGGTTIMNIIFKVDVNDIVSNKKRKEKKQKKKKEKKDKQAVKFKIFLDCTSFQAQRSY